MVTTYLVSWEILNGSRAEFSCIALSALSLANTCLRLVCHASQRFVVSPFMSTDLMDGNFPQCSNFVSWLILLYFPLLFINFRNASCSFQVNFPYSLIHYICYIWWVSTQQRRDNKKTTRVNEAEEWEHMTGVQKTVKSASKELDNEHVLNLITKQTDCMC